MSRRRRFQFTLPILLLVPLLLAIILARYSEVIRDRWAARTLERSGVQVTLDSRGFVEGLYVGSNVNLKDDNCLEHVGRLNHLREVTFNNTELDESVVQSLQAFPGLIAIDFIDTRITDREIGGLAGLHGIEMLTFQGENLTKQGLSCLQDLPQLLYLNLGGSDIDGDDLEPLRQCTALKFLYLNGCSQVNERAIEHLSKIPNLKVVEIISTGFSTEGAQQLLSVMSPRCCVQGIPIDSNCPDSEWRSTTGGFPGTRDDSRTE